jgi:hypothetical protein
MNQDISSVRTPVSVPAVRYRDSSRSRGEADHELLIAGALFVALVIVGTAFFFAVAPTLADIASLYVPTT